MYNDNFSITDILKELSKLHDEFVISLQQDRNINKIIDISNKIDELLLALTNKTDTLVTSLSTPDDMTIEHA